MYFIQVARKSFIGKVECQNTPKLQNDLENIYLKYPWLK